MSIENLTLFKSQRELYLPSVRFFSKRVSSSHLIPKISRFINKKLYSFGIGSALNRYENSFTIYSSFADKRLYEHYSVDEIFCNFGSGAFYHPKWKNYDYPGQSAYYKCLQGIDGTDFNAINLCEVSLDIPEKDNSVALIYCSHTLEHLEASAAKRFLRECYRILKPKGVMRVALPNTNNDFYFNRLLELQDLQDDCHNGLKENFRRSAAFHVLADTKGLSDDEVKELFLKSKAQAKHFYDLAKNRVSVDFDGANPERHITFWDHELLIDVIQDIGFSLYIPVYQGSSVAAPFTNINVFDTTEPHIAFYAEILK